MAGGNEGGAARAFVSAAWTAASICSWKLGGSATLVQALPVVGEEPLPGDVGTDTSEVAIVAPRLGSVIEGYDKRLARR